jgi:membrane protein
LRFIIYFIAAGKGFIEDRVTKLSASLAYYTIFSLTPLIIILLSAATLFLVTIKNMKKQEGNFSDRLPNWLVKMLLGQIQGFVEHANKTGQSTFSLVVGIVVH